MQLDLIKHMTQQNVKRLSDDIWGMQDKITGDGKAPAKAEEPQAKKKADDGSGAEVKKEEKAEEPEKIEDLMKELDGYIGLGEVKKEVKSLTNVARIYKLRRDNDLPVNDISLHLVFSGNPGTGKTMIARLMSRVYHSLGLLSKGHLVETDRSGLVAGYVGQTSIKTAQVLDKALGGVLFIDEAYSLTNDMANDFGIEAVDTVLKYMEDHRDDIVVIVAGYTDLMKKFIESNPGLKSRFNNYIDFKDYTAEELKDIFAFYCRKGNYEFDSTVELASKLYFEEYAPRTGELGNARWVRNLFEKVLISQANRLSAKEDISKEDLILITGEDFVNATALLKEQ